jgi:DNA-binding NtrC family response regulator
MLKISILTNDKSRFSELSEAIANRADCRLRWLDSVPEAMTEIGTAAPHLVIIDEEVDQLSCLAVAEKIIMRNAMVNMAVVSELGEEEFHEATEGLGILAGLPTRPGKADLEKLLAVMPRIAPPR